MGRIKKKTVQEGVIVETNNNTPSICGESEIMNQNIGFEERMKIAAKVANQFQGLIKQYGLSESIPSKKGTKEYITVDGWQILALNLGIDIITESVRPLEGDACGYEASVKLVQNGVVLSRASAIAMETENDHRKEPYAVYSMAQTRAIGKAFRQRFGWLCKISGYESTPAEEMK